MILNLDFGFLTSGPMTSPDDAREFLQLLLKYPLLTPDRYGHSEPIRDSFHRGEIGQIVRQWSDPFLWKRRAPQTEGSFWLGKGLRHSSMYIATLATGGALRELLAFGRDAIATFGIDFGYINLFLPEDAARPDVETSVMPFRQGVTTHDLRRCIPDLPSVMILGKPYVDLIGIHKLLDTPAYVERLSPDTVCISLWRDLDCLRENRADADCARDAVKKHLALIFCGVGSTAPNFRFGL